MRRKIVESTLITLLLTALLFSAMLAQMLYSVFSQQTENDLNYSLSQISLAMNRESDPLEYLRLLSQQSPARRITWISGQGTVLFESDAEQASLHESHLDREEIVLASQNGHGSTWRTMSSSQERAFYTACQLADGSFLRLCATRRSILHVFNAFLRWLPVSLVLCALCTGLLAIRHTNQIVKPINELDLNTPNPNDIYPELRPLITRIANQSRSLQESVREIKAQQLQFDAITANMSEGLVLLDTDGKTVFINRSAARLFAPPQGSMAFTDSPVYQETLETALRARSAEGVLEHESRWYQLLANPVFDSGHFTGIVLLLLEITDRYLAEKNRREFTANVSHELKTPLTSIIGYAEIMSSGLVAPEDMRGFSGQIYQEGTRLLRLVQDILHLSRMDSGVSLGETEPVDLFVLAESILERHRSTAEKKPVALTLHGESVVLRGYRQILDEMISNLVDNAIKYNVEQGSVTLSLSASGNQATLSVADTGIGIPPASQDRVFERFFRVDKSRSKATGGTGLGLSIVKHAVMLHEGTIHLSSRVDHGTTITIQLPLSPHLK